MLINFILTILVTIFIVLCAAGWATAGYVVDAGLDYLRETSLSSIEPYNIPNIKENNYFEINDVQIRGLSSVFRHGDCTIDRSGDIVKASVGVGVRDVEIDFKYAVNVPYWSLFPLWLTIGEGTVTFEKIAVRTNLSGKVGKFKLDSFEVEQFREYKIKKITGIGSVLKWFPTLLFKLITIQALEKYLPNVISDFLVSEYTIEANDLVDKGLKIFRATPSIEPLSIQDKVNESYTVKNCQIKGLSELYRHGECDCTSLSDGRIVKLSVELAVPIIWIDLKGDKKIATSACLNTDICVKGKPSGRVDNLAVRMGISMEDWNAKIDSLEVVELGTYKIKKLTGMGPAFNWLVRLMVNSEGKKSREKIIDRLEKFAPGRINGYLNSLQSASLQL